MANSNPSGRRVRVRSSAPTLRERVEAAKAKEDEPAKPRRTKKLAARVALTFKKLRLRDRKAVKMAAVLFKPVKKLISWIFPSYFINSWREVRQVHWPNRRETWRLTLAVFIFAVVFGAMVAGVDKGLDEIFKKVVLK